MILGIDPGITGAIALVSLKKEVEGLWPVPRSKESFINLFELSCLISNARLIAKSKGESVIAYLEKVNAMPGQGVCSMFTFGRAFGAIEGILSAQDVPYVYVTPRRWSKAFHEGISGCDPKEKSAIAVSRIFPNADLRATPRCKTPHKGIIDALLIAEYGRLETLAAKLS